MDVLGQNAAENLRHNSFLRGLASGTEYVMKHCSSDEFPYSLIDLRTRELWGRWRNRETMVMELAAAHMRPCNLS